MSTSNTSFLIPGIGYVLLGLATAVFGLLRLPPLISFARSEQASGVQLVPLVTLALIIFLITVFYFAMGLAILKRRWRLFVVIGAGVSCIMIPFGTIFGLIFLLWTRREWPASPVTVS